MTLSPVWTPIGSTFSIEQTMTQLSLRSRMTSSSNSPQPSTDSSSRIWPIGEASRPPRTISRNSSGERAMPPPRPPSVYAGRMMIGRPMSMSASSASAAVVAIALRGIRSPACSIVVRNSSRSSARQIASYVAPMSSTPCSASVPFS